LCFIELITAKLFYRVLIFTFVIDRILNKRTHGWEGKDTSLYFLKEQ